MDLKKAAKLEGDRIARVVAREMLKLLEREFRRSYAKLHKQGLRYRGRTTTML